MVLDYNIYLELAALMFDIILIFAMRYQSSFNENGVGEAFFRLSLCVLGGAALDVISAITISLSDVVPLGVNMGLNTLYFVAIAVCAYRFTDYIEAYVYQDRKPPFRLINRLMLFVVAGILLFNIWTGIIFDFNEAGKYYRGAFYLLVYVVPLYYIIYSVILMAMNRSRIGIKNMTAFVFCLAVVLLGMILQMLVFPTVLLTFFAASVGMMGAYFSLESPDYNMLVKTMSELEESKASAEKLAAEVQELNRNRSTFLSNFSHEIHPPINAVIAYNERLRKEQDPAKIREYSDGIDSAGRILVALVNDIADYIEFDPEAEISPENEPYEVRKLFENIGDYAEYHLSSRNVWFESAVAKSVPQMLKGDGVRITQIVNNLITNSIKNTQQGTITLRVRWQKGTDPTKNGYLVIAVNDTGTGMKEEEVMDIREYLDRIRKQPKTVDTSRGMGMTVVGRILAMMNGTIAVDSLYGRGTNVTVRIPQEIYDEEELSQAERSAIVPHIGFAAGQNSALGELEPAPIRVKRKELKARAADAGDHGNKIPEEAEDALETETESQAESTAPAMAEGMSRTSAETEARSDKTTAEFTENKAQNPGLTISEKEEPEESLENATVPVFEREMPERLPFLAFEYYDPMYPPYSKVVLMQISRVLDVMIGLTYCMEDSDMYMDILRSYLDNNVYRSLEDLYRSRNWQEYHVKVRGLKNSSRTIGAAALSEMCKDLEALSGSARITEIPIKHDVMMNQYQLILSSVAEALANGIRVTKERREQAMKK